MIPAHKAEEFYVVANLITEKLERQGFRVEHFSWSPSYEAWIAYFEDNRGKRATSYWRWNASSGRLIQGRKETRLTFG